MTDRWWDRRDSSLAALERVDASDVQQGVGTAVLAYHGLSKAVLEPLAHMTLMDVSAVNKALHGLDIAPVAKALGSATRDEMGSASGRYGQLLADDIHATAIESTGRLITSLVQSGMAWPVAIDRASKVHGIPTDRLGKAGPALRAPVMQPLAADDIADRALMEYASRFGRIEATATAVSKSGQERFQEEEVVRDEKGRFSEEGRKRPLKALSLQELGSVMEGQRKRTTPAEKAERLRRRAAVRDRLAVQVSARNASLAQLAAQQQASPEADAAADATTVRPKDDAKAKASREVDLVDAARDDAREKMREKARQKVRDAAIEKFVARLKAKTPNGPRSPYGNLADNAAVPLDDGTYPGWTSGSGEGQHFMLLDKDLALEIARQGSFNYGTLAARDDFYNFYGDGRPMTLEELRAAVIAYSYEPEGGTGPKLNSLAVIVLDGVLAYREDLTKKFSEILSDAGTYTAEPMADGEARLHEDTDIYSMGLRHYRVPTDRTSKKVDFILPHLTVELENGMAFRDADDFGASPNRRNRALGDDDYETQSKSWDETQVMRDEDGKFAEEGKAPRVPLSAREKREKLAAKRMRVERRQQVASRTRDQIAARDAARAVVPSPQQPVADRQVAAEAAVRADTGGQSREDFVEQARDRVRERAMSKVRDGVMAQIQARADARRAELSQLRADEKAAAAAAAAGSNSGDALPPLARVFNEEHAYGTFIDVFGVNPYNGVEQLRILDTQGAEAHEEAIEYVTDGLMDTGDAIENMHVRPPTAAFEGKPKPAFDTRFGPPKVASFQMASDIAQFHCDEEERKNPLVDRVWLPHPVKERDTGLYVPYMQEAWSIREHIVVLGSKADWGAVGAGEKVTLVPERNFSSNEMAFGQGRFDALFARGSTGSSWEKHHDEPRRSDFYVRAFRIKT